MHNIGQASIYRGPGGGAASGGTPGSGGSSGIRVGRYSAIKVPVPTIGGWIDGYVRSERLANIEGALDRLWAIYGSSCYCG